MPNSKIETNDLSCSAPLTKSGNEPTDLLPAGEMQERTQATSVPLCKDLPQPQSHAEVRNEPTIANSTIENNDHPCSAPPAKSGNEPILPDGKIENEDLLLSPSSPLPLAAPAANAPMQERTHRAFPIYFTSVFPKERPANDRHWGPAVHWHER